MKILHCLAQLPQRTGSGIYYTNLIEGLDQKGVTNAMIYAFQEPHLVEFPDHLTYPVQFLTDELFFPITGMSDEMPYESTMYSKMNVRKIKQWEKAFKKRLYQAKEEFKPDLIISHHLWKLTSIVLDIFTDVPVIGIGHGTDIRQAKKNHDFKVEHVDHLNRLKHVFALSKDDKQNIIDTFQIDPEKIEIIGGGFNQNLFYKSDQFKKDKKIRLVFAGKLSRAKGVYELAKAYPNLKRKYKELKLYFIGNADEKTKEILYENGHYKKDFHIFNTKNQAKLAQIMRRCDLFVLPSYYEGLGLIALEALACQMRVVVTEIKGLQEQLGPIVNQSAIIDYVKLPRLYDTDKPIHVDIDDYVMRLEEAIENQIIRIKNKEKFPDSVYQEILKHSWKEIVNREYQSILRVWKENPVDKR